ncbi:Zn(II)2Cys6 transcription factor domain-containing protein [Aspergillus undulatus]|uniref:Zn(II)2Cys6 transcription factor domain-containing protein n=1 Tax=Aspergillus undulatus TaxID=1810928 RepID=UPI003CCCFD11
MPVQASPKRTSKPRKIIRGHSGCKACRKRGKKCDESKPSCRACIRLHLECSYLTDWSFRNVYQNTSQQNACLPLCTSPLSYFDTETRYLDHFRHHVQYLLPAYSSFLALGAVQSPHLKFAVLSISASNLSMLNTAVQTRSLTHDARRSVFSPLVNQLHQAQARKYHDQALSYCRSTDPYLTNSETDSAAILTAYTVLAYYHHASTNHRQFRFAVWDTVRFVSRHRDILAGSETGRGALQMWYRLCVSHRLGKPPALLLEGEGESHFGPNRYPDSFQSLYLDCILGMSADDLVYDILIKTIEIRSRLVVFEAVSGCYGLSEMSRGIGGVAYNVLSHLIAENSFMRGPHLRGLMDVQRGRLEVWKTRLARNQWPDRVNTEFPTHRDAMNALYALLCEMMFDESNNGGDQQNHVQRIIQILNTLDLATSATADIYTFSLSEVLLQLALVYKSDAFFTYLLDDLWSRLETKARGYEHSHYPTHLVKRTIALLAQYRSDGRDVRFALPAVAEDIPKVKLMDIYHPIDLVICGCARGGKYFVERVNLP